MPSMASLFSLPSRTILYYLDEEKIPRPLSQESLLLRFSQGLPSYQRLLATHLQDDRAQLMLISTVFTGVAMSCEAKVNVLFETMIFGGRLDGSVWRYETFEQAVNGHAAIVSAIASEWLQLRLPHIH